jgi:hypothetical protein
LSAQIEDLLRHPEVAVVHGRFARWVADSDGVFRRPPATAAAHADAGLDESGSGWLYPRLLLDSLIHIVTAVVRRELYQELGGLDESLRTGEDYDFWLRACTRTPVRKLAMDTALYRVHKSSTTKAPRPISNEYWVVRRALQRFGLRGPDGHTLERAQIDRRLTQLCVQHAYRHFWWGDPCIAATAFVEALSHSPGNARCMGYALAARLRCMLSKAPLCKRG